MASCKNCRELENELILTNTLIEAIYRVINGQEVSDFELSFPAVRKVADIMGSQSVNTQDTQSPIDLGVPCQKCGRTDGWICNCCL